MKIPLPTTNNTRLTGDELNQWMNANGYSVKEFADLLGVSEQAVKLWKTGRREFNLTNSRVIRLFNRYPQLVKEFKL